MNRIAQIQIETSRRAMLEVLSDAGSTLHAQTVRSVMDGLNHSTTWESFLNCIAYLVGEGLICVFPVDGNAEMTIFEQERYINLLRQASYDSQEARLMMLRLRQPGRRFLEGHEPTVKGVA
jgi:hypothetical protein